MVTEIPCANALITQSLVPVGRSSRMIASVNASTRLGLVSMIMRSFRTGPAALPCVLHSAANPSTLKPSSSATLAAIVSAPRHSPWTIVLPFGSFDSHARMVLSSVQYRDPQTKIVAILAHLFSIARVSRNLCRRSRARASRRARSRWSRRRGTFPRLSRCSTSLGSSLSMHSLSSTALLLWTSSTNVRIRVGTNGGGADTDPLRPDFFPIAHTITVVGPIGMYARSSPAQLTE